MEVTTLWRINRKPKKVFQSKSLAMNTSILLIILTIITGSAAQTSNPLAGMCEDSVGFDGCLENSNAKEAAW
jgi:hypothetical protein